MSSYASLTLNSLLSEIAPDGHTICNKLLLHVLSIYTVSESDLRLNGIELC